MTFNATTGASVDPMSRSRFPLRSTLATVGMLGLLLNMTSTAANELTDVAAKSLLNARSCNACHGIDEVRLGPSFRSVALRYADAPASQIDWLAQKIIVGGAGSWGFIPMISNPGISTAEAQDIASWILTLQKPTPTP